MTTTSTEKSPSKMEALKAFDDTKAGVKGLVDTGITTIPPIFRQPSSTNPETDNSFSADNTTKTSIPTIDLEGLDKDNTKRNEIVEKIRDAGEKYGFFQIVNHGIELRVLEEMRDGIRRFHEQDVEERRRYYTRDTKRAVGYNSNFDLYSAPAANWRDTFKCSMAPNPPHFEDLPEVCRDIVVEYSEQVMKLGNLLFNLLSEALGLDPNHLIEMGCTDGLAVLGHYYPACPQPELTIGTSKHSDNDFLTVLLQDQIGGLQVLINNKWTDVPYVPGALVVNFGDFLQLITNDRFKSIEHRVLANRVGPRISVACFFTTGSQPSSRIFGPIKELLSEDNPPRYKEITIEEYVAFYYAKGLDGTSALPHFKL